jgi:hypothetical protein
MARTSAALIATLVCLAASHALLAQSNTGTPPPGTNSVGTAQSSGGAALNRQPGVTTGSAGLGSGNAAPPPATDADAAIKKENQLLDSKLKSICRGC